jgi:hypothetical protein
MLRPIQKKITYDGVANGFTANHEGADLVGDPLDGVKVALRGNREAGLEDIDSEARELLSNLDLLVHCESNSWRLD